MGYSQHEQNSGFKPVGGCLGIRVTDGGGGEGESSPLGPDVLASIVGKCKELGIKNIWCLDTGGRGGENNEGGRRRSRGLGIVHHKGGDGQTTLLGRKSTLGPNKPQPEKRARSSSYLSPSVKPYKQTTENWSVQSKDARQKLRNIHLRNR